VTEPFRRLFRHQRQLRPPVGHLSRARVAFRHRHPRLARQNLHRLDEAQIFGFLDEGDGIALGMTAEAVIVSLPVIYMKRRGFFLMKRAGGPHVALAQIGFAYVPSDLAPDNGRQADAGAQFIKEAGRQTHHRNIGLPGP
jgi:hypothetical protein